MDFEDVMLNEINQIERKTLYNFTHMWNMKKRKILLETEQIGG